MSKKFDLLVLGATGFTGRLVTRYLLAHPKFPSHFTFAIAGRSRSKLDELVEELSINSSVPSLEVDITQLDALQAVVQQTKVVINTVGPFWHWGTPVVRACVRQGVHYVDITGETPWVKEIVHDFDYAATKTGAIIVPSCGLDSAPSDIVAFLSNKALKEISPEAEMGESVTAVDISGGISGGTLSTAFEMLEIPRHKLHAAGKDYGLSPMVGRPSEGWKILYRLPHVRPTVYGFPWFMKVPNRGIVQRTWGLNQVYAQTTRSEEARKLAYGPRFRYDEFWQGSGMVSSFISGVALMFGFACFIAFKPLRWLVSKCMPPGSGPSEDKLQKGYLTLTNISTSTSPSNPITVKSIFYGQGDPGYLLTSIMLSEAALCLAFDPLSELAKKGGVLTPMTACGDNLIQRLEKTGRFKFEHGRLASEGDSRKTR